MLVYTTTGAGTWGPPMRVGTRPEIVLIEFA
jgi:predicted MPP superfamily phosphohydrolase